jgi:hypothetical protein
LLFEALKFLFDQARAGDNPAPQMIELGRRKKLMVLKGKSEEIESAPPYLTRTAKSLDSLAQIIRHENIVDPDGTGDATHSQVYVDESGVTVILDEYDRAERLKMSFAYSAQYVALQSLQKITNQKLFIATLRGALHGCCSYPDIIRIVRKIEFKRSNDGVKTIEHGRESLGRSVEMAVQSIDGDKIPEELTFRVNLFSTPSDVPSQVELSFALDIDVTNEGLTLIPIGDIETRERLRVLTEIAHRLEELVPEGTLVASGTVS